MNTYIHSATVLSRQPRAFGALSSPSTSTNQPWLPTGTGTRQTRGILSDCAHLKRFKQLSEASDVGRRVESPDQEGRLAWVTFMQRYIAPSIRWHSHALTDHPRPPEPSLDFRTPGLFVDHFQDLFKHGPSHSSTAPIGPLPPQSTASLIRLSSCLSCAGGREDQRLAAAGRLESTTPAA